MKISSTGPPAPEKSSQVSLIPRHHALVYIAQMLRLAAPQRFLIALFLGLYLVASFSNMLGLVSFKTALASMEGHHLEVTRSRYVCLVLDLLEQIGLRSQYHWIFFFSLFFAFSVGAAALDHLGWVVRLRLLSDYESNQICHGLHLLNAVDPRDRGGWSDQELRLAVRSDCKSMRTALQMCLLLAISFVQIICPFWYICTLNLEMSLLGLGVLLLGFYPVYLMGKKVGRLALEHQNVGITIGTQLSDLLKRRDAGSRLNGQESVQHIRQTIKDKQRLWRQQYQIRSLAQKTMDVFAKLATYAVLLWGAFKISQHSLSWGEMITFLVATRVVFNPFAPAGGRYAKIAEFLPKAMRHLNFIETFSRLQQAGETKERLVLGDIDSLVVTKLPLQGVAGERAVVSLELRCGQILTVADDHIDRRNPLLRALLGAYYLPPQCVCINGHDINHIHYEALQGLYTYLRPERPYWSGTLLAGMQALGLSQAQAVAFSRQVMGAEQFAALPGALEVRLPASKAYRGSCLWLYSLCRAHCQKRIMIICYEEFHDTIARTMIRNYLNSYGRERLVILLARAPLPEVQSELILGFKQGVFRGSGDREWFRRNALNWQLDWPARPCRELTDLDEMALLENEIVEEE